MNKTRIAIIRISGNCGLRFVIKDTLKMLRLYKKFTCIVIPNTPAYLGMLKKVKDFVTWGEIDDKTFTELLLKRGKLPGKQVISEQYIKAKTKLSVSDFVKEYFAFKKDLKDIPGLKSFFRLNPPKNGFEKKGTKKPFSMGGVLGYRKDKINELIKRMI
ncbi:MAG: 50S ribosomal protein L30 [Nanoarchaeota archaeon]|nr:50S ribosomal protein L30 [Nanoarchaeota archaeon]